MFRLSLALFQPEHRIFILRPLKHRIITATLLRNPCKSPHIRECFSPVVAKPLPVTGIGPEAHRWSAISTYSQRSDSFDDDRRSAQSDHYSVLGLLKTSSNLQVSHSSQILLESVQLNRDSNRRSLSLLPSSQITPPPADSIVVS